MVQRFTGSRGDNDEPNLLDSREIRRFVVSTRASRMVGAASVPVASSFRCQRVGGACCRRQRLVLVCTFVVAPLRPPAGPTILHYSRSKGRPPVWVTAILVHERPQGPLQVERTIPSVHTERRVGRRSPCSRRVSGGVCPLSGPVEMRHPRLRLQANGSCGLRAAPALAFSCPSRCCAWWNVPSFVPARVEIRLRPRASSRHAIDPARQRVRRGTPGTPPPTWCTPAAA